MYFGSYASRIHVLTSNRTSPYLRGRWLQVQNIPKYCKFFGAIVPAKYPKDTICIGTEPLGDRMIHVRTLIGIFLPALTI